MVKRKTWLIALTMALLFHTVSSAQVPEVTVTAEDSSKADDEDKEKDKKKKKKGKAFEEVIEDYRVVAGLFTLYEGPEEKKVYLEIKPEQFDKVYLCNITRESGEGYWFDAGAMLEGFPFFFTRVGKTVQFVEKNLKFRADPDAAISRAVQRDIPNSIRESAKIASEPHPERGSVLIDASELFLKDVGMVSYLTGRAKMSYSLDKGNSYFSQLKSFPQNTEIEVTLNFTSSQPKGPFTLADSRSMSHRYHFSLSEIPQSDYRPRPADDRLGHFYTMHQDYTSTLREDPYERYVNRWHLEKAEPKFNPSPPRQPIVFWLENTIPVEYRPAIREGVLLWNQAFARLGFKNALVVKQMPDDADWDPADARYNTIRWIVQPGAAYAVGPSRANPFTGQIYDADIRISADIVRFFYDRYDEFVQPAAWRDADISAFFPGMLPPDSLDPAQLSRQCHFGRGFLHQLGFGWSVLQSQGQLSAEGGDLQRFIHDALLSITAHEVGHTLGLRHNFKASSIHPLQDLQKENFAAQNGLTGSVMDYTPINLSPRGGRQDAFFQTTLGPYDYWAIEYAYKPYDPNSGESEPKMLDKIARRAAEKGHAFGTDEDAFGLSVRSIDPTCNLWDMGADPLTFYRGRLQLTRELWDNLSKQFEEKGERYPKLREVFNQGLREYALAGLTVSKFIGGIYHHRDHIGDPGNRPPLEIVPAARQREALAFLSESFFSPNSFRFSPELLNKLAPERYWDFQGTVFRMSRLDYPIHGVVQLLQAVTLFRLFEPLALIRLQDNEIRFTDGEPFTMVEQFKQIREAIWQELQSGQNINSFRRELQRMHLYQMDKILLKMAVFYPHDAVTLARADLVQIRADIDRHLNNSRLNAYTMAHLRESAAKIDAMLEAQMERFF